MVRILLVGQDKGGVGKSTAVRALAEAVPHVDIIEFDISHRLVEFDAGKPKSARRQVQFFPMRADRKSIEQSGGAAARAEFDKLVYAIEKAMAPTVVDIGANTSTNLFAHLSEIAPDLKDAKIELGVLILVTREPGALTKAEELVELAKPWADALFVLENKMQGDVDPERLTTMAQEGHVGSFAKQLMESVATEILQDRGMRDIPNLEPARLSATYGISLGSRIRRDLTRFRVEAMESVLVPANWLVG